MSMFIELNSDMSPEEMREAIKKNEATARTLKNKIKAIDAVQRDASSFNVEIPFEIEEDEEEVEEEIEDEEEEFKYYYDNMMDAIKTCDDMEEAVNESLPVKENGNYVNIIRRIILELMKEKSVYAELLEDDDESVREDALIEQERIDYIISLVRNHHNIKKEETSLISNAKNNIIFLKTISGNVYAEQDLALISSEWYPSFKGLLETIEDGTFKNVKRLTSNRISQGIPEVKDYGIRIVFDKVNPNTYIILDMLVKKSDHDKGYSEQLINRLSIYRQNEKEIKASVTDELIENDRVILESIKKGLDNKYIVKTKGGDTNGL